MIYVRYIRNLERFESIMRQINLKEEDTLYILGDVTHNYLKHVRKEYRAEIFEYLNNLPLNYDVTVNDVKYKLVHVPCKVLHTMGNSES